MLCFPFNTKMINGYYVQTAGSRWAGRGSGRSQAARRTCWRRAITSRPDDRQQGQPWNVSSWAGAGACAEGGGRRDNGVLRCGSAASGATCTRRSTARVLEAWPESFLSGNGYDDRYYVVTISMSNSASTANGYILYSSTQRLSSDVPKFNSSRQSHRSSMHRKFA